MNSFAHVLQLVLGYVLLILAVIGLFNDVNNFNNGGLQLALWVHVPMFASGLLLALSAPYWKDLGHKQFIEQERQRGGYF